MRLIHLYHDLMNLYGDYANVAAMRRLLEKSGAQVTVDKVPLGGDIQLDGCDFLYIGSGTERNMRVALEDLRRCTDALRAYIDSGRVLLLTGNAFEMLGNSITDAHGVRTEGLGLLDFAVTEQNKTRMTADVVYHCDFLTQPLVGFVNKCSDIRGVPTPLFTVEMGLGNTENDRYEGVRVQNCFGTHLTGPVLIKNPHFLEYLAGKLLGAPPQTAWMTHERAGYEVTLHELRMREGAER